MNNGDKKPKRERPEERLVIDKDPETAVEKLFGHIDEEIRRQKASETNRQKALAILRLRLLRKRAAEARKGGYIAEAERIEEAIARMEQEGDGADDQEEPGGD